MHVSGIVHSCNNWWQKTKTK